MAQTSANLVDHVLPRDVPLRQWVVTFPFELRGRFGFEAKLLSAVCRVAVDALLGFYEWRLRKRVARPALGGESSNERRLPKLQGGTVTVVQRTNSDFRLNPHLHVLALDGQLEVGACRPWDYARFIPPSCTGCEGGYGQQTQMFQWMLDNDATVKVAVLSYYEDSVIGGAFNGLSGPEYKELLLTETGKVQAEHSERFKRFMLPGTSHVVSGGWGTVTADGVEVSAWMNAMVTGDDAVWRDILAE